MATRKGSGAVRNNSYFVHEWAGLLNGEDGAAVERGDLSDKTVQVSGTFGAGGTVLIEGSMDGTTWATLRSPLDTALSLQAAAVHAVLENPRYLRPRVSAGDGTTSLTVVLGARSRA